MTSATAAINDKAVPSSLRRRRVQRVFCFGTIERPAARLFFVDGLVRFFFGFVPIPICGPCGSTTTVLSSYWHPLIGILILGGNLKVSSSDQQFFRG